MAAKGDADGGLETVEIIEQTDRVNGVFCIE